MSAQIKKTSKLSQVGEFPMIDSLKKQFKVNSGVFKGIGDDTAVFSYTRDKYLLFTTDTIIEGAHFTKNTSPVLIGQKALSCNVSDIAAMGGTPKYALVSLCISPKKKYSYVQRIYQGIKKVASKYKISIIGGDTAKSHKVMINIALIGEVFKKQLVLRSGAKKGDKIFTTGALGNSFKSGHHLKFQPRIKESQYLVKHFRPHSMIDISDGLAADLGHIIKESRVGAVLDKERIPKRKNAQLNQALFDGEDYELIFTLSKKEAVRLMSKKQNQLKAYQIGEIVSGNSALFIKDKNQKVRRLEEKGFKHF